MESNQMHLSVAEHLVGNSAPRTTRRIIRAELVGSDECTAAGLTISGKAPVLALCRQLIAGGHDPGLPLEVWRGPVLCLRVRSIGEAARLRVATHGGEFERLPKCASECTAASPVQETAVRLCPTPGRPTKMHQRGCCAMPAASRRSRERAMSSHKKDKGRIEGPFVPMLVETMQSAAWRAMSPCARVVDIALKSHYSFKNRNNGRIYLSDRDGADETGFNKDTIACALRELEHYGFIVLTEPGCLGVNGRGKAPHWRLTELGYMYNPPTRDLHALGWCHLSRAKKPSQKTESRPVTPESVSGYVGHTTVPSHRTVSQ